MAARRRTEWCKELRHACWNGDGVHGRTLEMKDFLSQHGVDICILSEHSLILGKPCGTPIMSATAQTDQQPGAAEEYSSAVV